MTDSEMHELVGRTRFNYKESKKELAGLRARALELAKYAATISRGLETPEMIRWFDGMPSIGRGPQHIIFTTAMFNELSEKNIRQLWDDLRRVDTTVTAMRKQLTELEGEDPEG